MTPDERWDAIHALQDEYPTFEPFLYDVMTHLMGFDCSPLQLSIARYLQFGPTYRMIQAQRGQAKTTITGAYGVWRIIHDPSTRVLIISSGGPMATEISGWIIQIIEGMDVLECLRADKNNGDRSSVEAYDVHWVLKGPEKSPSIASVGITSNLQGKRADVLIADDIESSKNSATEHQRDRLRHLTKDFSSICSTGDIIYLGTPQSVDSIYNGLPSRGFDVRIWPGRFPTTLEIENYGKFLAPDILAAMTEHPDLRRGGGLLGDRGQPTDPVLLGEEVLQKKELDQGMAYFQLQHMLDTRLSDAERYPLKSERLVFMNIPEARVPLIIDHVVAPEFKIATPPDWPIEVSYYRAASFGAEFGTFNGTAMYVDPAGGGQNGDETGYAVVRMSAGKLFLVAAGGVKGGISDEALDALTAIAVRWKPERINVEENFGKGALAAVWRPKLFRKHSCAVEDDWSSGQKELRIIDTLEPIIGSGRLIVDIDLLLEEQASLAHYPAQDRSSYSMFYQLARITRDKASLRHEDRLEAVAGACRMFVESLQIDDKKASAAAARELYNKRMADPVGSGRPVKGYGKPRPITITHRMKRRY